MPSKQKKPYDRKGKDVSKVQRPKTVKCGNDPSWYKKYPQLVEAASSIIFNHPYGYVYDNKRNITTPSGTDFNSAIPGGYVATFRPAITASGSPDEPINVFVKNLYTFVRHANSGSVNYDSSDLAQYVLTVISLIPHIESIKTVLRLVLTYKATNRYVYQAMLQAYGFSVTEIQDMITNYAMYVTLINNMIAQFNTFKVPREFALIDRWAWLASHVFKDDELDKASLYMFKPGSYYHYDWANFKVRETLLPGSGYLSNYIGIISAEITNLLAHEDIGIMIGDILKAYKNENCFVMTPIVLGDVQQAEYSQEAGEQFRNMCVTKDIDTIVIGQSASNSQLLETTSNVSVATMVAGKLISETVYTSADYANIKAAVPIGYIALPVLMADSDSPSNDEVLVNTRLMHTTVVAEYVDSGYTLVRYVENHGTEIITNLVTFYYGKDTSGVHRLIMNNYYETFSIYPMTLNSMIPFIGSVTSLLPTRYAPQYNNILVPANNFVSPFNLLCGVNNIVLETTFLNNIHQACLLSLLTLPMFKLLETN